MRAEEMAVNARYGEDVQREVMDETPPRVGRTERRMFS
jgi:GTP cyclohydrolase I